MTTLLRSATDDGTPFLRLRQPGMADIFAFPVIGFWVARLHDGRRGYETEAGCIAGMRACLTRTARSVLAMDSALLDALTDIASGHNDPRARAMAALDAIFPTEG